MKLINLKTKATKKNKSINMFRTSQFRLCFSRVWEYSCWDMWRAAVLLWS